MITILSLAGILVLAVDGQVFPAILTRLGGSPLEEGLLLASLFFLYPVSSVMGGALADRIGKRRVVAAGMLLVGLSFAFSAVLGDIGARTLAVLLFGFGGGVVESQTSALLSDTHPRRERAVLSLSQTLFSAGAAGGPLVITFVAILGGAADVAPLLWGVAAVNLLLFLLLAAAPRLERRPAASAAGAPGTSTEGAPRPAPAPGEVRQVRELLREPLLWLLAAGVFLYVAAEMGTAAWLAKWGETVLGLSRAAAPLCLTAFWGGQGLSRSLVGLGRVPWSDRALLLGSLTLSLAGQVVAFSVRLPAVALTAVVLTGFGMGAVWPTMVAAAGVRFRRLSGTAVGIVVAAGALATPFVQPLVGLLSRPGALGLQHSLLALAAATFLDLLLVMAGFRSGVWNSYPEKRTSASASRRGSSRARSG